jgi:3-oxoacyl-[acyl-carrier protein] reductase
VKRALVTGGSGDLGSALCRKLASEGHHVYVHANSAADRAEAIAAQIRASAGSADAVSFDVTDPGAVNGAIEKMLSAGAIQILVNNAGIHDDAVMPGMNVAQWARVIDVSLNGFFHVTQPLLMPMMATRWGRIVNISSMSALVGTRGQANYAAAKAGLNGATRSLATELASRGITVNAVAPGIIESAMSNAAFDRQAIERLVPMKRAGKPEEVADLVGFLVSDRAAYISGQIISINGAMM